MDFQQALKTQYYQPTVQDLSGEILINKYPSFAGKCQHFHDGVLVVRGQTITGAVIENLTVSGGGTFIDCYFKNCEFHARHEHGENVLSIFGGSLTDCVFNGFYNKFDFLCNYAKNVLFLNGFETLDLTLKINCAVWRGVQLDDNVSSMLFAFLAKSASGIPIREQLDLAEARIKSNLAKFSESL